MWKKAAGLKSWKCPLNADLLDMKGVGYWSVMWKRAENRWRISDVTCWLPLNWFWPICEYSAKRGKEKADVCGLWHWRLLLSLVHHFRNFSEGRHHYGHIALCQWWAVLADVFVLAQLRRLRWGGCFIAWLGSPVKSASICWCIWIKAWLRPQRKCAEKGRFTAVDTLINAVLHGAVLRFSCWWWPLRHYYRLTAYFVWYWTGSEVMSRNRRARFGVCERGRADRYWCCQRCIFYGKNRHLKQTCLIISIKKVFFRNF